jgi:hypothetical protein
VSAQLQRKDCALVVSFAAKLFEQKHVVIPCTQKPAAALLEEAAAVIALWSDQQKMLSSLGLSPPSLQKGFEPAILALYTNCLAICTVPRFVDLSM